MSLIVPYMIRWISINRAAAAFRTIWNNTSNIGLYDWIRNLNGLLFQTNPIPGVVGSALSVFHVVRSTNVPAIIVRKVSILLSILGIIGRLSVLATYAVAIPIVSSLIYILTKEISIANEFLTMTWNNLPEFIRTWIIDVNNYVYKSIGIALNKSSETIKTGFEITSLITIIKTITYMGGWSYIHSILTYLDSFAYIHLLYDNYIINAIIELGIVVKIWGGMKLLGMFLGMYIIQIPGLDWILTWLFFDRTWNVGDFVLRHGKSLYDWVKSFRRN